MILVSFILTIQAYGQPKSCMVNPKTYICYGEHSPNFPTMAIGLDDKSQPALVKYKGHDDVRYLKLHEDSRYFFNTPEIFDALPPGTIPVPPRPNFEINYYEIHKGRVTGIYTIPLSNEYVKYKPKGRKMIRFSMFNKSNPYKTKPCFTSAKPKFEYYTYYTNSRKKSQKIWIKHDKKGQPRLVKHPGQPKARTLKFVKARKIMSSYNSSRAKKPVLLKYYDEVYNGKITGRYITGQYVTGTKKLNWVTYIRKKDNYKFSFTHDVNACPSDKLTCF